MSEAEALCLSVQQAAAQVAQVTGLKESVSWVSPSYAAGAKGSAPSDNAPPASGSTPSNNGVPTNSTVPNDNAALSPSAPPPAPALMQWTGTSSTFTPESGSQCVPTAWITGCGSQCQAELQILPATSGDVEILSATGSDGNPIGLTKGPGPEDGEYEFDNSSPLYFSSALPSYSVTVTAEIADVNDPPSVNLIMDGCS